MTTMIAVYTGDGCAGRCDASCYHAMGPECTCICGGRNNGIGRQEAIENTRQLGESWLKRAEVTGKVITLAEVAAEALHQPSFEPGGA
jgi:hypothetical protein